MTIRPFRLPQDIDRMIAVVQQGFQYPDHPEWSLQADDSESAADMARSVRRLGPLLTVLRVVAPRALETMRGFVWDDGGRIGGMALVSRIGASNRYEISTVTVLPDLRGQGIARALVEACVGLAREREGKVAELSVIDGNVPAQRLYESMGFELVGDVITLNFLPRPTPSAAALANGYHLDDEPVSRWRPAYEFARRITPPAVARFQPVEVGAYSTTPVRTALMSLFFRVSGDLPRRLFLREDGGDAVIGVVGYQARTRPGGTCTCTPHIDPAHSSLAASLLVAALVTLHQRSPGRRIEVHIDDWQPAMLAAAKELGCVPVRRSHHMALAL